MASMTLSDAEIELEFMKQLASIKHKGQMYNNLPYTYHLSQVAEEVTQIIKKLDLPYDMDVYLTVAFGHDIVEDTNMDEVALQKCGFSQCIIYAIMSVTKIKGEPYIDYINRCKNNKIGKYVKIADTLSNLIHSTRDGNAKRIIKYTNQLSMLYS